MTNLEKDLEKFAADFFNFIPSMTSGTQKKVMDVRSTSNYPPYDIIKDLKTGRIYISIALAGFKRDEITVETVKRTLTISGKQKPYKESDRWEYLHKGVASRDFKITFNLAEDVVLANETVSFIDGLLQIDLVKIEAEEKSTIIEII